MEAHTQDENRLDMYTAAQAYKDGLVDDYLKWMTVDAVEDVIDGISDCLANLWILHKKDEKKRNRLIIQQIESSLLNEAETAVENEYE